jgi:hypothetical protein
VARAVPPSLAAAEQSLPPPVRLQLRQRWAPRRVVLTFLAGVVFAASVLFLGLEGLLPFGLLLAFSIDTDDETSRSVLLTPWNLGLAVAMLTAFAGLWLWYPDLPTSALVVIAGAVIALPLGLEESADDAAQERRIAVTKRGLILSLLGLVIFVYLYQDRGAWLNGLALVCVVLPLALAMSRGWAARRGRLELGLLRHPLRRDLRAHLAQALNIWVCCALLGAILAAGGVHYARIGFSMNALQFNVLIATFAAGLVLLSALALVPRRRVQVTTNVVVALLSGFLAVELIQASILPADAVELDSPLVGEWFVYNGGRSTLLNGHLPNESHSVDFARLGANGRTHAGGTGDLLADYAGFGAPLLAPADGTIVVVSDGYADNPPGTNGDAANHVVMDIGGGLYLLMAHVKQGSIMGRVGDVVRRGQLLASVGNNGHSDEPHLHLQVQDSPAGRNANRTYPMVFRNVLITRGGAWPWGDSRELRTGDIVTAIGR